MAIQEDVNNKVPAISGRLAGGAGGASLCICYGGLVLVAVVLAGGWVATRYNRLTTGSGRMLTFSLLSAEGLCTVSSARHEELAIGRAGSGCHTGIFMVRD